MLPFNVPWKPLLIVGAVFGVGLILYGTIQYIQSAEGDKILLEIQEDINETRKDIRDELKNNKPADRNDPSDSLQYFEDRN